MAGLPVELFFYAKSVPASATTPTNLLGYTSETRWVATRAGSLQRRLVMLIDAVTVPAVTGTVKKNGAAMALAVTVNTSALLLENKTDPGITYAPGDLIELELVSSGLAPTTADALSLIEGT